MFGILAPAQKPRGDTYEYLTTLAAVVAVFLKPQRFWKPDLSLPKGCRFDWAQGEAMALGVRSASSWRLKAIPAAGLRPCTHYCLSDFAGGLLLATPGKGAKQRARRNEQVWNRRK